MPASATSFTDTFALGLTCSIIITQKILTITARMTYSKSHFSKYEFTHHPTRIPDEGQRSIEQDLRWNRCHGVEEVK